MPVRILVVDDNQQKLNRVVELMREAGISREEIDVAQTGIEARRLLTITRYDLLVLDIALPMRSENEPDRRGGIKLLDEIDERGSFKLPLGVVGLTGFDDLYREFSEHFRSRLWTLDHYDRLNGGWGERLKARARYAIARAEQKDNVPYGKNVCVICALHSPELSALRSLDWDWSPPSSLDEVGYYYEGHFIAGGKKRTIVAAAAPRMGMVATAVLSLKMIMNFRPQLLIMIGICAGVKANTAIGDVLVADPSWDWQMGKISEGAFYIAPDHIDIPTSIGERFVLLGDDDKFWYGIHRAFLGDKPPNLPTVKIGPVTSGSAVLADGRLLGEIKEQHRKLLGIEMELYGMYAAARDCSPPNPIAFGIKSVSDYADSQKDDNYQSYAAYVSARALAVFCERYGADFFH